MQYIRRAIIYRVLGAVDGTEVEVWRESLACCACGVVARAERAQECTVVPALGEREMTRDAAEVHSPVHEVSVRQTRRG